MTLCALYVAAAIAMFFLWWRQQRSRNANAVDAAWSLSFAVAVPWIVLGLDSRRAWVAALVPVLWSLRLGLYLLSTRVLKAKAEDRRYASLRQRGWGSRQFFVFYQVQALLIWLLLVPMEGGLKGATIEGNPFFGVGLLWGLGSILGEALADRQLKAFASDPSNRGKTCDRGLWRYSRHPNYFFEWLHWWTYVIWAAGALVAGAENAALTFALTLLGPVVMMAFLFKVTGIRPTEARSLESRSDYADYQRRTSLFFPWPPKSTKRGHR